MELGWTECGYKKGTKMTIDDTITLMSSELILFHWFFLCSNINFIMWENVVREVKKEKKHNTYTYNKFLNLE